MSYNTSTTEIINNVSGTPTIIRDLNIGPLTCTTISTQNSTINCGGGNVNASTITATSNLASSGGIIVNDGTNNTATVENNGQITCKNFLIRQPGTLNFPLSISGNGEVVASKVGLSTAQLFSLPSNTSIGTSGQVLSILDATSKTTQWITPTAPLNDYVTYNTTTNALVNNVSGTPTNISTLVLSDTLGISYAQRFSLPANTTIASNNYVLSLSSVSFKTTQWVPAAIIPTTTETSITTAIATASGSTVEMCRASNLVAGTYIITYQIEFEILTTTRAITYRSYGVSTGVGSLVTNGLVGLCVGDSVPYTVPLTVGSSPLRYSGSGVTVLTSTTTLYLLVRFVYTGTTFNTKGTMRVTKIA